MSVHVAFSGVKACKPTFMPSFASQGSSFPVSLRFLLCQDQKEQDIMRVHFKAMESYGEGSHASQAVVADKVELIQMLFDGLIDSLVTAKGHICLLYTSPSPRD